MRVALLVVGLAVLSACGGEGPEDPAVVTPGGSIPMGAPSAAGVSFDAKVVRSEPPPGKGKLNPKHLPPADAVPDPFAEPPPASKGSPRHRPSSHPPTETTL